MLEKVFKAEYIGKPEFKGLHRNNTYEVFIIEHRSGYFLEVLINPEIGHKDNKIIPYSNENSIKLNWEFIN